MKLKAHNVLAALFAAVLTMHSAVQAAPADAVKDKNVSVVRVNVSCQAYDFFHPWNKRAPYSVRALGAVVANKRVLVTAELVANVNHLELEKAASGEKIAATVEVIDYEANLALLKPADENFLKDIKALPIKDAVVGDRVAVWQIEATGAVLNTSALITTVEVARYPLDDAPFLIYRMTSSLQYRESSFTLPVIKDNKLVGLLMRYDNRSQNVDAIPAPVIEHFLKAAATKPYRGFPQTGIFFDGTRDPQLRRYVGLPTEIPGGVYITNVRKNSPGDKAGMKVGDVIFSVNDKAVDQDGNYVDSIYGKLSMVHLLSTKAFDGDTVKIKVFRDKKVEALTLTAVHRDVEEYVIEPYTIARTPRYYILGGFVLQELSRQYLKEWGADWLKKAPERFVYYDRYQADLFKDDDRKKVVILSQVMPTPNTVGYEELNHLVVKKINGVALKSLADVTAAIEKPIDGFHKIEFEGNPREIYFDAKEVEAGKAALMKNYGLRSLSYLE